jgi:hypothetical protein
MFFYRQVPIGIEWLTGPAYHKYLVYTDKVGRRHSLRGGPDHGASRSNAVGRPADPNQASPYGPVRFEDSSFEEGTSTEFDGHAQSLGEPYLVGEDLSETWQRIRSAFHDIEAMSYPYWPQGVNSNTIIDGTLARSGNHPTYRDGTAGNSEWTAPDRQGQETIWTPGMNHLPPPPGTRDGHQRTLGNGRGRVRAMRPSDLLELSDEDFAQATDGPRWREIWTRQ